MHLFFQIAAVVEILQSVETDLEKQISESELQAKLMREAIADIDEVGVCIIMYVVNVH